MGGGTVGVGVLSGGHGRTTAHGGFHHRGQRPDRPRGRAAAAQPSRPPGAGARVRHHSEHGPAGGGQGGSRGRGAHRGGPPLDDARFEQSHLLEEPHIMLVPADHPLARAESVRLEDAAAEDWVVADPGTCDHAQRVRMLCAAAGFSPRIVHAATQWAAVWSLVGNGLGVSLVPRLAEGAAGQSVVRVPVSNENMPMRRILTCVRRGSRRHPLVDLGIRVLEEVVSDHRTMDDWPRSA
ncbi:LysR substrate-binding domain-containing protein [Streptomyces sp. FXJ1.4098]|nr:LysR substrate-binding domain-containing protein [Streptomyces sp. FXJ1.4098]